MKSQKELFHQALNEARDRQAAAFGTTVQAVAWGQLNVQTPQHYTVVKDLGLGQTNAIVRPRPEVDACELCASRGAEFVDVQGQQIAMCELCRKAVT